MCDWEEKEFVEYLLWVEAAKAPARVRGVSPTSQEPVTPTGLTAPEPTPIEA